jgi:hypothetical protein
MPLTAALITTSATSVYTSSGNNAITCMTICNYSGTSTNLTLHTVPNNAGAVGTASNTNMSISVLPIPGGETVTLDQEKLVLANNDSIQALASANTRLNIVISTLPV